MFLSLADDAKLCGAAANPHPVILFLREIDFSLGQVANDVEELSGLQDDCSRMTDISGAFGL